MGKNFFGSDVKDSYPNRKGKDKINYQFVLDNIPSPVSLWKMNGEDFLLVYLNKAAEETIESELYLRVPLSKALPDEYKRFFYPISSKNHTSYSQILIDKDLLLIIKSDSDREEDPCQFNYRKEPFKTLIDLSPVSVVITDIQGNIEVVNKKFTELTGYSEEEVICKNPRILKSGDKSREEYKVLWDTILSGKIWQGEFRNVKKNGELYYESAVISPLPGQYGKINNFIGIKEDITDLKRANDELKKSERFTALGKMAAYVSHEIKTPLTSIKINIDRLEQKKEIDDDSKKSFSTIQKEIKRLANLLKNTLQFSNLSSAPFTNINLYTKIENVKGFLEPLLIEKKVTLLNKTAGHNIFGNPLQLRSAFIHLIENSIESMDAGGEIEISSEIKASKCHIFVKDNGCGIKCTENIFEPFFTTKPSCTGLGLPIVKNIIDKHNGEVRLVSSRPRETIFEIILPVMGIN